MQIKEDKSATWRARAEGMGPRFLGWDLRRPDPEVRRGQASHGCQRPPCSQLGDPHGVDMPRGLGKGKHIHVETSVPSSRRNQSHSARGPQPTQGRHLSSGCPSPVSPGSCHTPAPLLPEPEKLPDVHLPLLLFLPHLTLARLRKPLLGIWNNCHRVLLRPPWELVSGTPPLGCVSVHMLTALGEASEG